MDRNHLASDRMDFFEAMYKIGSYVCSRRLLAPTERQIQILKQHKQWHDRLTRGEAYDRINAIFAKCSSVNAAPGTTGKR